LASPSLFGPDTTELDGPPAYELKFLLGEEQARDVAARVARRLAPDPYGDSALDGAYRTTSVYTDTPQFDVFHRAGNSASSKLRARRYGAAGPVFLERKDKDGDKVRKCRSPVPCMDLTLLGEPAFPDDWPGGWFHVLLNGRRLRPVCRVSYDRVAFLGTAEGGAVRVTFDRNIRGEAADGWELVPIADGPELLLGEVICEFKFRLALPLVFKDIVAALNLAPSRVSKYRRFMRRGPLAGQVGADDA
jgi:hypothetical protein